MPNTNLTIDWIGNEALRLAHEKAQFIGTINRQFDDSFVPGRGNAIRIRIPSQYTQTSGRVIDVQDGVEQSTNIVVATQNHVAMRYNSQEFAQDLVNFQKLHLEPAMAQLVSYIDGNSLEQCTRSTYNIVGTANTPISSLTFTGLARARLNQYLAPKDNRAIVIDSVTMSEIIPNQAAYFAPQKDVSERYREGFIARTAMADYYENERVWSMANTGDTSTWLSSYTLVDGDVDITVSSLTTDAPIAGMTFTIGHTSNGRYGAVYACHPETKQPYTHLQTFVIQSVADGVAADSSTFTFQPPIRLTGARKNVCDTTGADLTTSSLTSAIVRFTGGPLSTYAQPLMYHRDAYTFASAALPLYADAIHCVVKTFDGISLRVWEASDIRNDEKLTRIDILWGISAIRPQWACRLIGTAI